MFCQFFAIKKIFGPIFSKVEIGLVGTHHKLRKTGGNSHQLSLFNLIEIRSATTLACPT